MSKQLPARLSEADPEFLRLSVCYLEGELSAKGVEKLQAQLRADPAKREAFVRLCLTGSALIEAMSEGAAGGTGPSGDKTKLDAQTEWPQSNDLNDAMVLPAVVPDAEPPEPEALTIPLPAASAARHPHDAHASDQGADHSLANRESSILPAAAQMAAGGSHRAAADARLWPVGVDWIPSGRGGKTGESD